MEFSIGSACTVQKSYINYVDKKKQNQLIKYDETVISVRYRLMNEYLILLKIIFGLIIEIFTYLNNLKFLNWFYAQNPKIGCNNDDYVDTVQYYLEQF